MPKIPTLVDMLKAGVHFGHQKSKWHPKMRGYIYTVRHGIHILDLEKTTKQLEEALAFVGRISAAGGTVLFVSLKKQADEVVKEAAVRTSMPYIVGRWLGGVFTNFSVIAKLIRRLEILEADKNSGAWLKYSKKEQLERERDFTKLNTMISGIRNLTRLPDVIFLIGTREAKNALREARKVKVPIVAMVDTNTNPGLVDYPIPANDDALQPIVMVTNLMAETVLEGRLAATVAGGTR
ncbi:MAG: 30S ribosomal protein S2 [Candidatus Kerfeldbacteria bacterium]|nr:30S ribosomal protein S2 [Candidatus Kerfeldbacteria bacterium]